MKQSKTLKEEESLFALNRLGGISFKKTTDRKRFRRKHRFSNPVFLTSKPLSTCKEVELLGRVIETMKRDVAQYNWN